MYRLHSLYNIYSTCLLSDLIIYHLPLQAFAIFCGMAIHNTVMYENVNKAMAKQKVALEVRVFIRMVSGGSQVYLFSFAIICHPL